MYDCLAQLLSLSEMGEDDALWERLVSKFGERDAEEAGEEGGGRIRIDRISDLVPMDPRLNLMMKAMVSSVAGVSERLERAQARAATQGERKAQRVILMMRKKIIQPVFAAWAELVQTRLRNGRKAARAALHSGLGKGWRRWVECWSDEKATRERLAKFMRRLMNREIGRGWNQWFEWYEAMLRLKAVGNRMRCAPKHTPPLKQAHCPRLY